MRLSSLFFYFINEDVEVKIEIRVKGNFLKNILIYLKYI